MYIGIHVYIGKLSSYPIIQKFYNLRKYKIIQVVNLELIFNNLMAKPPINWMIIARSKFNKFLTFFKKY